MNYGNFLSLKSKAKARFNQINNRINVNKNQTIRPGNTLGITDSYKKENISRETPQRKSRNLISNDWNRKKAF